MKTKLYWAVGSLLTFVLLMWVILFAYPLPPKKVRANISIIQGHATQSLKGNYWTWQESTKGVLVRYKSTAIWYLQDGKAFCLTPTAQTYTPALPLIPPFKMEAKNGDK